MKFMVSPKSLKSINANQVNKIRCFTYSGIRYIPREYPNVECSLWPEHRKTKIRTGDSASAPMADATVPDQDEGKAYYIAMSHSATESWNR